MSRALGKFQWNAVASSPTPCAALQELMSLKNNQQARLARLEVQVELVEGQLASLQVGKCTMLWARISLLFRTAESVPARACPLWRRGELLLLTMCRAGAALPGCHAGHREQGWGPCSC